MLDVYVTEFARNLARLDALGLNNHKVVPLFQLAQELDVLDVVDEPQEQFEDHALEEMELNQAEQSSHEQIKLEIRVRHHMNQADHYNRVVFRYYLYRETQQVEAQVGVGQRPDGHVDHHRVPQSIGRQRVSAWENVGQQQANEQINYLDADVFY